MTGNLCTETKAYDLVVIGGGMSGISAAVTAARIGLQVALLQERPVLGGNASKEIRVMLAGANGSANNAYFRETGLMEELRLNNLYWNPSGNAEHWNVILLNLVMAEDNVQLFLNTTVTEVEVNDSQIDSVIGYTLGSEKKTCFTAPLFVDATGDGTIGHLAGAKELRGRESKAEYGESLALDKAEPYTMGSTMMFKAKDTGQPVYFQRPPWVHKLTDYDFRVFSPNLPEQESYFTWLEWGGELDTINQNEDIQTELSKIVYGIWDYVKNDPKHQEKTKNLDLEWVAPIAGKRSSRRLEGPHILTEHDIRKQVEFTDVVAYGGWYFDDHHSNGFWEGKPFPRHMQTPGLYGIPLRCLYSVNINNLFMAGRNLSASHVALGSTRVMLTCAQLGEAVGAAASECIAEKTNPGKLSEAAIKNIQQELLCRDHYIPGIKNEDREDLAQSASVEVSSEHQLAIIPQENLLTEELNDGGRLVMFPVNTGEVNQIDLLLLSPQSSTIDAVLWQGDAKGNFFPVSQQQEITQLVTGNEQPQWVRLELNLTGLAAGWYFLELNSEQVKLCCKEQKLVGIRLLKPETRRKVINPLSRWCRAGGSGSPCIAISPNQPVYQGENVINGIARPADKPNLWISGETDFAKPEQLILAWDDPQAIKQVQIAFDTDLDRHLRNVWHPNESCVIPECARSYRIEFWDGDNWQLLIEEKDNYQRLRTHDFASLSTTKLRLSVDDTWGASFASVYEIRVFAGGLEEVGWRGV